MSSDQKRLFIVDGTALAYRSYFALIQRPLINSRGLNTSAIFGFSQSLLRLLDQEQPDYLAVAFDSREPTFRHKMYDQYKATREKMPDDLVDQLPYIEKIVGLMNIPYLAINGYEADDIIGTVAKMAKSEKLDCFIVSGDKDFTQLVDAHTFLYQPGKSGGVAEMMDAKGVESKFGVPPQHIVDYLALVGDSSDNVPGVPGIGPKTASKLIKERGTVETILQEAESGFLTNKKLAEKLIANKENALLSKELVHIKLDVPNDWHLKEFAIEAANADELAALFKELEFQRLEERFLQSVNQPNQTTATAESHKNYQLIENDDQLDALIEKLEASPIFAFDCETTSLNFFQAKIVGVSFALSVGEAYYVPVFQNISWLNRLKPILENEGLKKGGHNAKYDALVLRQSGIRVKGIAFDTLLESYLLDPTTRQHKLDVLAARHFNYQKIPIEQLIGKGKSQVSMDTIDPSLVSEYACEDADITLRLHDLFTPQISHQKLEKIYNELELPIAEILQDMEFTGIHLDTGILAHLGKEINKKLKKLEKFIYEQAGEEFNIASPKQLGVILFEKLEIHKEMELKRLKKTKTGYSTDVSVLESLLPHPLATALIQFRNLTKLRSSYIESLPALVNKASGTIHTHFNQAVAATGRLSSSDPNLQNIPIRTDMGKAIREAFVSGSNKSLLMSADYSQIELRILAHLCEDENLVQFFKDDLDIHSQTACRIFKVNIAELTPDLRGRAKAINFGLLYGMGPKRLAQETGVTLDEAEGFIKSYFDAFPKVETFIETSKEYARSIGYAETILGRKRPIPDIQSSNPRIRAEAERIATNTPIQGSAADLVKVAMIKVSQSLVKNHYTAKLILQVHDELVFNVPKDELAAVEKIVKESMENALRLSVPLKVEIGSGRNWLQAHP